MAVQSNDRFMARAIEDSKSDAKEHQRCDAIEGYKPDAIIYRAKIPILVEDGYFVTHWIFWTCVIQDLKIP